MKFNILSGNALKLIAAVSMVIDHVGLMFFPANPIFRIIGRLAFPIFAFMIAESARYTRNKLKHFLTMFSLAVICQIVYYFFDNGSLYMCVLVTFSIATLLIYILQQFKRVLFDKDARLIDKLFFGALFAGGVIATYFLNNIITIDYGFMGCITPVLASLFDLRNTDAPESLKRFDTVTLRTVSMIPALIGLMIINGTFIQPFCIFAIPILLLYSGKRGTAKLKYFFYIFYPLHLALLEGIFILIYVLK